MCRLRRADVICSGAARRTPITTQTHDHLIREALAEARKGLAEGGLPIGSVLADGAGKVLARGHNLRVQMGDPTAHAEVACIRNAGRRRDWNHLTLVSTLSPCVMCTGTALLFHIPRVIIGENQNFRGAEELFSQAGVEITVLDNRECIEMMKTFIAQHPELWNEDIGVPPS
jgi:creatinine deaminase